MLNHFRKYHFREVTLTTFPKCEKYNTQNDSFCDGIKTAKSDKFS